MLIQFVSKRFSASLRNHSFARFTTLVSIVSVALGNIALIVSISVLNGYEETIEKTALRYLAHIEIRNVSGDHLTDSKEVLKIAKNTPGVQQASMVLTREALARSRSGVDGVVLYGLQTDRLRTVVGKKSINGSYIGSVLARQLGLTIGDTLVVYAADDQQTTQAPVLFSTVVEGLLVTGMHTVDESTVVMSLEALAQVLRTDTANASAVVCTLHDPSQATEVASVLSSKLTFSHMSITWKDRFRSVASWIELQKQPIPIVLALISIVAVFTVISTLLVTVVEKARSLAILATLGMPPQQLMAVVLRRAIGVGIVGSVVGVSVSVLFAIIQNVWQPISLDGTIYYVNALPVSLEPLPYLIVPFIATSLSVIAAIIPMLVARKLQPVQVLRFS